MVTFVIMCHSWSGLIRLWKSFNIKVHLNAYKLRSPIMCFIVCFSAPYIHIFPNLWYSFFFRATAYLPWSLRIQFKISIFSLVVWNQRLENPTSAFDFGLLQSPFYVSHEQCHFSMDDLLSDYDFSTAI